MPRAYGGMFYTKIGDDSLRLGRCCWGFQQRGPKLIIRGITFQVTQPIHQHYGRTDNTALCTMCIAR